MHSGDVWDDEPTWSCLRVAAASTRPTSAPSWASSRTDIHSTTAATEGIAALDPELCFPGRRRKSQTLSAHRRRVWTAGSSPKTEGKTLQGTGRANDDAHRGHSAIIWRGMRQFTNTTPWSVPRPYSQAQPKLCLEIPVQSDLSSYSKCRQINLSQYSRMWYISLSRAYIRTPPKPNAEIMNSTSSPALWAEGVWSLRLGGNRQEGQHRMKGRLSEARSY